LAKLKQELREQYKRIEHKEEQKRKTIEAKNMELMQEIEDRKRMC